MKINGITRLNIIEYYGINCENDICICGQPLLLPTKEEGQDGKTYSELVMDDINKLCYHKICVKDKKEYDTYRPIDKYLK